MSNTASLSLQKLLKFCRRASFEFVKAWAQPKTGLTAAEVRLCVATKLDRLSQAADAQRAAWLEDARTWCSEELIEYVEVRT